MNLTEELIFRNASEEDVKYIVAIAYSETNSYLERAYGGSFNWERWENELRQDIYNQNSKNTSLVNQYTKVMIIESFNQQIGFIWFSYYSTEIIWLDSIIIDPNHQGKGYGHLIINHLIKIFRDHFTFLDLGVQQENIRAIKFYKELGFYQVDDIVLNYNITNRMRKNLTD